MQLCFEQQGWVLELLAILWHMWLNITVGAGEQSVQCIPGQRKGDQVITLRASRMSSMASISLMSGLCFSLNSGRASMLPKPARYQFGPWISSWHLGWLTPTRLFGIHLGIHLSIHQHNFKLPFLPCMVYFHISCLGVTVDQGVYYKIKPVYVLMAHTQSRVSDAEQHVHL